MNVLAVFNKFRVLDLVAITKSLVDNLTRLPIHFSALIMQFDYSLNKDGEASLLLGLTESGAEQKLKRILKKLRDALQN